MPNVAEWSDERLCTALAAIQNGQPSELPLKWAAQALDEYERRAGISRPLVKASDLLANIRAGNAG